MIFAVAYRRGYFALFQQKLTACIVTLLSIAVLMYLFTFNKASAVYTYFSFTIEAICWGLIAVAYLSVKLPDIKRIDSGLAKLGEISFSFYILHLPIGNMLNKVLSLPVPTTVLESLSQSLLKGTITILVSLFTFYLIEKPFMSLRVKYTQ